MKPGYAIVPFNPVSIAAGAIESMYTRPQVALAPPYVLVVPVVPGISVENIVIGHYSMMCTVGSIPSECLALEKLEHLGLGTEERGVRLAYTGIVVPGHQFLLQVSNRNSHYVEYSGVIYAREAPSTFRGPKIRDFLDPEELAADLDREKTLELEKAKKNPYREELPSYEGAWSTACDES